MAGFKEKTSDVHYMLIFFQKNIHISHTDGFCLSENYEIS
jgi:hypothetical protein